MPDRTRNPKRPRDIAQLAKFIVDQATGQEPAKTEKPEREKNPAAVALGKLGGAKGGKARAKALSPERRREIATKAAEQRWRRVGPKP